MITTRKNRKKQKLMTDSLLQSFGIG